MNQNQFNTAMQGWMDKQKKHGITGQLVVEEGKVSLQLDDGSMVELSKNDRIEVMNGYRFKPAPYSHIIAMVDSAGWPLYAGLYASVERWSRSEPIDKPDSYKERRIHMDTKEVIDHCPVCEKEIFFGQVAWKVGPDLCCSVDHMLKRAKVVIVIAGREEIQHDYTR